MAARENPRQAVLKKPETSLRSGPWVRGHRLFNWAILALFPESAKIMVHDIAIS